MFLPDDATFRGFPVSRSRALLGTVALLVISGGIAGVTATTAAAAAGPAHHLAVTALEFSPRRVTATQLGGSGSTVIWTVTDTRRSASNVYGQLTIGAPGATAGTYNSEVLDASFSLRGSSQADHKGNARKVTFTYSFQVPQFDKVAHPAWRVLSLTVRDNKGDKLVLSARQLRSFRANSMTSTNNVDTGPPTIESFELASTLRPFVYSGSHGSGSQSYSVCVFTWPAWLDQGTLWLSGPDSQRFSTSFSYSSQAPACSDPYTNAQGQEYVIPVKFPAGLAPGTWTASKLQLMDSAGNVSTITSNLGAPVTVTGNQVLTADGFTATPNPANDWSGNATVTVSMNVAGASGGVSAVYLDFAGEQPGQQVTCVSSPGPLTPAPIGSNEETVQFSMAYLTTSCQLDGIAIQDGDGHLALYGSEYGAPAPGLTVTQVPDTTPPVATSAGLSASAGQYTLTLGVSAPVAPVNDVDVDVYNSQGQIQGSAGVNGGVPPTTDGTVSISGSTSSLAAGTYSVGFTIDDAGGLSSTYGPGASTMPGGQALTFTVP